MVLKDWTEGGTVISGGVHVPQSAFQSLDGAGMDGRIPIAARPNVLKSYLTTLGLGITVSSLGSLAGWNCYFPSPPPMELFFRDQSVNLARWPNYPQFTLTDNSTVDNSKFTSAPC